MYRAAHQSQRKRRAATPQPAIDHHKYTTSETRSRDFACHMYRLVGAEDRCDAPVLGIDRVRERETR